MKRCDLCPAFASCKQKGNCIFISDSYYIPGIGVDCHRELFYKRYSFTGHIEKVDITKWSLPQVYDNLMRSFDVKVKSIVIVDEVDSLPSFRIEGELVKR